MTFNRPFKAHTALPEARCAGRTSRPTPASRVADKTLRWIVVMLAMAVVTLGTRSTPAHAAPTYPEDAVKAVFLYRFAGYVTWPESTTDAREFRIAVLGAESVAGQLKDFLPEHPIQGRTAQVATIQGIGQLGDARILYIGSGFGGKLSVLIEALKDRPILIVTDRPGALEEGSTVNFLLEQQHVRFEISTAAAKRSGLQISSGLLAVAERIKTGDVRGRSICRPFGGNNTPCPQQFAAQMNRPRYRQGG